MSDSEPTIFLIDGSGYIFRAYYAVRRLSTSTGVATNAVFGFTNMLLKVLRDRRPENLAIVFDPGGKNFRHEIFPEYKANRSAPPEDLPPQIPLIHEVVDLFRINRLVAPGFEADDVIATAVRIVRERGQKVRIITGDKDLMQLVTDDVHLIDDMRGMRDGEKPEVDADVVKEKFGVPPERVVDVLALAGDSSDNVPGVKGIGAKTAAQLVNEFGDLEAVLAAAPGIKQKARRERLIEQADQARLSMKLVTLDDKVDLDINLADMKYSGPDREGLRDFFEKYEFTRLMTHAVLKEDIAFPPPLQAARKKKAPSQKGQADLFSAPDADAASSARVEVEFVTPSVVTEKAELVSLSELLGEATEVGLHVERDVDEEGADVPVGLGLSVADAAFYVPLLGPEGETVAAPADVDHILLPALSEGPRVVCPDGKAALVALARVGLTDFDLAADPSLASYLRDPEAAGHDIAAIAERRLQTTLPARADVVPKGRVFANAALPDAARVACASAAAARLVIGPMELELAELGMTELYQRMELPLAAVLAKLERVGVCIDTERLAALATEMQLELDRLEKEAHEAAGEEFNLLSPQQISELLFEKLGLKVVKRTKTGASTDSSVLEQLQHEHPLPKIILEHRAVVKLKNTYVDVLPRLVRKDTGRVHTRFHQTVAATGRLSSSDPNLQNIPARTPLGRRIRAAFVAAPGTKLLSLDYSQIELRLLAHVSGDPVLVDTFEKGDDVHQRTAAEIFDLPLGDVSKDQRTAAKAINFGLLYGMGVLRLARELGIKRGEAKEFLDRYFERYAGVRAWRDDALQQAHADGYVTTLFGRRRQLPGLKSANRGDVARSERLATNTPIQGSAADLIKRAMVDADAALTAQVPGTRVLLQVHDELLIEAPDGEVDVAMSVARKCMVEAATLRVPLVVDGAAGQRWSDIH